MNNTHRLHDNDHQYYHRLVSILSSKIFFIGVMGLALFQGLWLALSARYPMAFDEAYHYDLIRLHAERWNPLFMQQPAGPAPYGALVRDPSWLHHYVLSIPYRILDWLGVSDYGRIVALRIGNVLMFIVGLWLFRRLLLRTKASVASVHATLLFFCLVPVVPMLSGQINYDNLQFPLVAVALLLTHRAAVSLSAHAPQWRLLAGSFIFGLLGTLNKFTFLPIFAAQLVYLAVVCWRAYPWELRRMMQDIKKSWRKGSRVINAALVGVVIAGSGLWVWFYGVNTVQYQNPVVQCHQVLEPSRCVGFEPWLRNYTLAQQQAVVDRNPLTFTVRWIGGMFYRSFFVINGATGPKRYTNMVPIGAAGAAVVSMIAAVYFTLRYGRRAMRSDTALQLLLLVAAAYCLALWARNYNDYLHLGEMVAINGRYFQPILPILILFVIACYQHGLARFPALKLVLFSGLLLGFSSGGGIVGFWHYSDVDWYFESRAWIVHVNEIAKRLTDPLFLWIR